MKLGDVSLNSEEDNTNSGSVSPQCPKENSIHIQINANGI